MSRHTSLAVLIAGATAALLLAGPAEAATSGDVAATLADTAPATVRPAPRYQVANLGPHQFTPSLLVLSPLMDAAPVKMSVLPGWSSPLGAIINGKLYAVGGCIYAADCNAGMTNRLDVFDPATDTWTRKAPMPTARAHAAIAAVGGKLFVAGGAETCPTCDGQVGVLEIYDPTTDRWTGGPPMPTPREYASAAVVGGLIYVIGGWSIAENGLTTAVEAYDPQHNRWLKKAPLPKIRDVMAVAVIDRHIYAIASDGNECEGPAQGSCDTIDVYDPASDLWTTRVQVPTRQRRAVMGLPDSRDDAPQNGARPTGGNGHDWLAVRIDIAPGIHPNVVDLEDQGKIGVAILSDAAFDAPGEVDRASLTFGGTGDELSLVSCASDHHDVNGDARADLVCRFRIETAFQPGDQTGILRGLTRGGQRITGSDSIVMPSADADWLIEEDKDTVLNGGFEILALARQATAR